MKIDKNSDLPLHVQLKNILKNEIIKGNINNKLPSERELMDEYSLSRSTVRQTINVLVDEGVLEKIHGRGTFVSFRPVEEWLGNLSTYNEVIENMGMSPSIVLLEQGQKTTPEEVAELFTSDKFYYIKRLRYADDIPIAVERQYYPVEIGEKLAEYDLNNAAIYDLLESSLGIKLWDAEEIITSRMPTEEECELLNISQDISIMETKRFISDIYGKLVEYERSYFRSDMYAFRIKLTRRKKL